MRLSAQTYRVGVAGRNKPAEVGSKECAAVAAREKTSSREKISAIQRSVVGRYFIIQGVARTPKPDLFTFVAEVALQDGKPVPITCNCGGVITIMPPMQEDLIVCPKCESRIKINVLAGDPGYVMGMTPEGEPMLIPVQGSSKDKLEISPEERRRALEEIRQRWDKKG